MGSALAIALKNAGFHVIATRRTVRKMDGLKSNGIDVTSNNRKAIQDSSAVVFSLKPMDTVNQMHKLNSELSGKIVISMCAGLPVSTMESILPDSIIIRGMTNVAARSGNGYTIYSTSDRVSAEQEKLSLEYLKAFGNYEKIDEEYMDPMTPISGSGPAYIFTVIESMVYAGLKVGIPRDLALRASYQAMMASTKLVEEDGASLSDLKETFITPGGVTIEGIYELENSGIKAAFMKAIEAAADKARNESMEFMERMEGKEAALNGS